MRSFIAVILTLLLSLSLSASANWEKVSHQAMTGTLLYLGTDNDPQEHPSPDYCTATPVAKGYALVAGHCVTEALDGSENQATYTMTVDGRPATLIAYEQFQLNEVENPHFAPNPPVDLALLKFAPKTTDRSFKMSKYDARMGQPIMVLGFGYGFDKMAQFGFVQLESEFESGMMLVNCDSYPGDSGGPVLDEHGALVGIAMVVYALPKTPYAHFGGAARLAQIQAFLEAHPTK